MYASATIAHTTREVRRPITVDAGDGVRTIRVRPGRSTARRAAIAASSGFGR
ncbi:hypothetical protein MED01_002450 [Micromonospora sp. MED01]|uniref:hypothetical protein n=1 Tax=Micromonospora alfalfae TaxID=2911212 RepID=UPI001EE807F9|nr:hypothetical protein [Micromonospora alfalfae]MCG5464284.1 hypothetical protein [Micromonospora alfalfae]